VGNFLRPSRSDSSIKVSADRPDHSSGNLKVIAAL
jgi:hypothetical protein